MARRPCSFRFDAKTGTWAQEAKLTARDGAPLDRFGTSVALDGATALVGADLAGPNGQFSGSAYLFRFDTTTGRWTQGDKVTPSDGNAGDLFGRSVALDGATSLISAPADDDNGSASGSAYIFFDDIGALISDVEALGPSGDGTLNQGQVRSLTRKLKGARDLLAQGQTDGALSLLNEFRQQVLDLEGGTLTTEQADALIASVDDIIAALS